MSIRRVNDIAHPPIQQRPQEGKQLRSASGVHAVGLGVVWQVQQLASGNNRALKVSQPPIRKARKSKQQHSDPESCYHCSVTKTPLWRTGPCGPKTLCNTCGLRYANNLGRYKNGTHNWMAISGPIILNKK